MYGRYGETMETGMARKENERLGDEKFKNRNDTIKSSNENGTEKERVCGI